ncbi:Hypothetical predicted protein [Olea europaea subsp. europaea]|uniref:Uncharacterized protein n=1 Tax=Olea europaea subsp. europaea TaxID=158383 RepID=A0A8S0U1D4_OLEEU|nr:Hypothetical predicted protein [Olea europaea subsp. europaea]
MVVPSGSSGGLDFNLKKLKKRSNESKSELDKFGLVISNGRENESVSFILENLHMYVERKLVRLGGLLGLVQSVLIRGCGGSALLGTWGSGCDAGGGWWCRRQDGG